MSFGELVEMLNSAIWGWPSVIPLMVVVLLSYGIFITLRLAFIQIRGFWHGVKVVSGHYDHSGHAGDVNHFQALSTALSATVGIGNIAGVAIAIHFGGPGAMFWMWVSAALGMAIKYSECTLALHYRTINTDGSVSGGPMYYIEKGLGSRFKWLAVTFAGAAVICSFLTGNAVQANTVAGTLEASLYIPRAWTGIISALLIGVVIIGGIKRIGNVTAFLSPLMALLYVASGLLVLLLHADSILPAFGTIISSAMNPTAGAFGVGTGAFMTAMVWGMKRGLFSNEAGQGSAPIAHAAAKTNEPVREGVVGLLEPFIDTLIICTMTGLVIISTGVWDNKHRELIELNSPETTMEIQAGASVLQVENGLPVNGVIRRNNYSVDTLWADAAFTTLFSGTIAKTAAGYTYTDTTGTGISGIYGHVIETGAILTSIAFEEGLSSLLPPGWGRMIVTICVTLFGVSTAISWSYYGDRAIQYLAGDRSIIYYKVVYVAMHFIGAILSLTVVWTIGDLALGVMTIPNIISLFALSGTTVALTKAYFSKLGKEA
jgi:AGCS family alanine or glycine:cation symporter